MWAESVRNIGLASGDYKFAHEVLKSRHPDEYGKQIIQKEEKKDINVTITIEEISQRMVMLNAKLREFGINPDDPKLIARILNSQRESLPVAGNQSVIDLPALSEATSVSQCGGEVQGESAVRGESIREDIPGIEGDGDPSDGIVSEMVAREEISHSDQSVRDRVRSGANEGILSIAPDGTGGELGNGGNPEG